MHPKNKYERKQISKMKSWGRSKKLIDSWDIKREDSLDYCSKIYRNTTKICSCSMCGNPRNNDWLKKEERMTIQERKFLEMAKYDMIDIL